MTNAIPQIIPGEGISTHYRKSHLIAELLFYVSLMVSQFVSLIVYIPYLAFLILAIAFILSLFNRSSRLAHTFFPFAIVICMAAIDCLFHTIDIITLTYYSVWAMTYCIMVMLTADEKVFYRCRIFLLCFLLLNLMFITLSPDGRIALDRRLAVCNPNDLGDWCGYGFLLCLAACLNVKSYIRIFCIISTLICAVVIIGTGSRGAMISSSIGAAIYMMLVMRYHRLSTVLLGAGAISIVVIVLFHSSLVGSTYDFGQRVSEDTGRIYLLKKSIQVTGDNFWLGTGENDMLPKMMQANTPHNCFLSLAVHYGVVPAFLMLALWASTLWKASVAVLREKDEGRRKLAIELFAMSIFLFLICNVSNTAILWPFCAAYMARVSLSSDLT